MGTAIGYVRVSSEEQKKSGLSIEYQKERVQQYASKSGLALTEIIEDEGVSAGKVLEKRPGGSRLVEMLKRRKGKVNHVIAIKQDRVWRDNPTCVETIRRWWRRGVSFHNIDSGGAMDPNTSNGDLNIGVRALIDGNFRMLTAERTRAALSVKKARGEAISSVPPYGYKFVRNKSGAVSKTKRPIQNVVPHAGEQRVIALVKQLRDDGETLRGIVAELAARDILNRKGRHLTLTAVANIVKRAGNDASV
jgi:DNA invertase Pin-like site-specific DNA recombinase